MVACPVALGPSTPSTPHSPSPGDPSSQTVDDITAGDCVILSKILAKLANLPDMDPPVGGAKAIEPSRKATPVPDPSPPPSEAVSEAPRVPISPGSLERVLALLGGGRGGGGGEPPEIPHSHLAALQSQSQAWLASSSAWPPIPCQLLPPAAGPVAAAGAAGPVLSRCLASCSEDGPIRLHGIEPARPEYPGAPSCEYAGMLGTVVASGFIPPWRPLPSSLFCLTPLPPGRPAGSQRETSIEMRRLPEEAGAHLHAAVESGREGELSPAWRKRRREEVAEMCRKAEGRLAASGGDRRVRLCVAEPGGHGSTPVSALPAGALLVECIVEAPEAAAAAAAAAAQPEAEAGVVPGREGGAQRLTIEVPAMYPGSPARALFSSSRPEYDTPLGLCTRTWFMAEIEFSKRWDSLPVSSHLLSLPRVLSDPYGLGTLTSCCHPYAVA